MDTGIVYRLMACPWVVHSWVQGLLERSGRPGRRWVGLGKNLDVNTGPWELTFEDASTNRATSDRYNRPPAR
jgi:hypothetical protein